MYFQSLKFGTVLRQTNDDLIDVDARTQPQKPTVRCSHSENSGHKTAYYSTSTACVWLVFTCVSYAEARNRYRLDVRLSVCLSVTRWYCIKTAEYIIMLSSPHDSPFILVLCIPRSSRKSDGVTLAGALNTGGV